MRRPHAKTPCKGIAKCARYEHQNPSPLGRWFVQAQDERSFNNTERNSPLRTSEYRSQTFVFSSAGLPHVYPRERPSVEYQPCLSTSQYRTQTDLSPALVQLLLVRALAVPCRSKTGWQIVRAVQRFTAAQQADQVFLTGLVVRLPLQVRRLRLASFSLVPADHIRLPQ